MKHIYKTVLTAFLLFSFNAVTIEAQVSETKTAVPANDFLNTIGVNSAINARGENITQTMACAEYLGFRWIRVAPPNETNTRPIHFKWLFENYGVRFGLLLESGFKGTTADITTFLDKIKSVEEIGDGILIGIEGSNEPNNWPVTYNGATGGGTGSWLPLAELHRDLYTAVKADPILGKYPVWSLSDTGAATENVGLHYLTIPDTAVSLPMPAGTKYADYATCHNYFVHPSLPVRTNNQTWIASDPTIKMSFNGLYSNFGKTWKNKYDGYPEDELLVLPRVTTETGMTIDGLNATEELQARMYLSIYLSQFARGWSYTAIYILRDRSDESGNQTFGFYTTNYTPRRSAHYLHNMTSILADNASTTTPKELTYSISPSRPETVHELLLQKNDGTLLLVVWGEKYARTETADNITVQFDRTFSTINVYNPAQYTDADPNIGKRPVATYENVNSIPLVMLNHPFIIEFEPVSSGIGTVKQTPETFVYPSAVEDMLHIQSSVGLKKLEIVNLAGKNVYSSDAVTGSSSVDLSYLQKGLYILRLTTMNNKIENHKIIKL